LSQLVGQRNEASEMVYRWFRFRVRRGLGVFYSLLSAVPVLGTILGTIGFAQSIVIPCVSIAVVVAWVVSRISGLQGFGRMASTMMLLKGTGGDQSRIARGTLDFVAVALWPWIAYAIAAYYGQVQLELLFAALWLVELVTYRVLTLRRNKDPIVDHTLEDWLVIVCIPVAALVSTLHPFAGASNFGFILISPLLLFSGLKSLYDAPKELVTDLGSGSG